MNEHRENNTGTSVYMIIWLFALTYLCIRNCATSILVCMASLTAHLGATLPNAAVDRMAMMPTADAAAFLGRAMMQLLEHKTESHKEIAAVVPAILTVLNDSKIAKSPSGEVLHRFIQWFHMSEGKTSASTDLVKCGWLRKISSSGITSHRRWAVLDGSTLLYYADNAETELKGVLQLKGAQVTVIRRFMRIRASGFAFEVKTMLDAHRLMAEDDDNGSEAANSPSADMKEGSRSHIGVSSLNLEAADVPPKSKSPATSIRRKSNLFVPVDGGSSGHGIHGSHVSPTLNPLHASKRTYVWVCETEAEREEWVAAITAATESAFFESDCLSWSCRFASASTLQEYVDALQSLGSVRAPLSMGADWVRVHMAASHRRGLHSHGSKSSLDSRSEPLVMLPAESSGVAASFVKDPLLSAASPRNTKLFKLLRKHDQHAKQLRDAASRKEQYAARADAAEMAHENVMSAVASAEASAQRRRVGYTPGDRVSVKQLVRDTQRDVVLLDDVPMPNDNVTSMVLALVTRMTDAVNAAFSEYTAPQEHGGVRMLSFRSTDGNATGTASLQEMRLAEFARELLTCTSRTVVGGDTFDALELILQNSSLVLVKPDPGSCPRPVCICVHVDTGSARFGQAPGHPSAATPMSTSTPAPTLLLEEADSRDSGVASGAFSDGEEDSVTSPRTTRRASGFAFSSGMKDPAAGLSALPTEATALPPGVSNAADLLPFLVVRVECTMRYALISMSEIPDTLSPAPFAKPDCEPQEVQQLGVAYGHYRRTFYWDRAPSAQVFVTVEPYFSSA